MALKLALESSLEAKDLSKQDKRKLRQLKRKASKSLDTSAKNAVVEAPVEHKEGKV